MNFIVNQRQQTMMEFSQELASIDPAENNTPTHRHDPIDRTVLLDKAHITEALKTHSTQIKLPDGSVTTATPSLPPMADDNGQTVSKHKLWLMTGSAALVFVVIAAGAYVYWSKSTESPETSATVSNTTNPAASIATAPEPVAPSPTGLPPAPVTNPATIPNTASVPVQGKTGPSAMEILESSHSANSPAVKEEQATSKPSPAPIEAARPLPREEEKPSAIEIVKAKPVIHKPQYQSKTSSSQSYSVSPPTPPPRPTPQPSNDESWLNDIHPVWSDKNR